MSERRKVCTVDHSVRRKLYVPPRVTEDLPLEAKSLACDPGLGGKDTRGACDPLQT